MFLRSVGVLFCATIAVVSQADTARALINGLAKHSVAWRLNVCGVQMSFLLCISSGDGNISLTAQVSSKAHYSNAVDNAVSAMSECAGCLWSFGPALWLQDNENIFFLKWGTFCVILIQSRSKSTSHSRQPQCRTCSAVEILWYFLNLIDKGKEKKK